MIYELEKVKRLIVGEPGQVLSTDEKGIPIWRDMTPEEKEYLNKKENESSGLDSGC